MRESSIRIALPWESYDALKAYFELVCPEPNYNPFESENMSFFMVNRRDGYVIVGWDNVFYNPMSTQEWAYYFFEAIRNLDALNLPYKFFKLDDNGDYEEINGTNNASEKLPVFRRHFAIEITENHNPAKCTYTVDNRLKKGKRGD